MSILPNTKVMIPKVSDQPQLSISSLFEIENMISENPEIRNEILNIIDKATYDSSGDENVYKPIKMKIIPTIKGMYLCLIELLMVLKKLFAISLSS